MPTDYLGLSQTGSGSNAPPDTGGDPYEMGVQADRGQLQEAHRRNLMLGLLAAGLATMGAQSRGWRSKVSPLEALGQGGLVGLETFGEGEAGLEKEQEKKLQMRQLAEYRKAQQQDKMMQMGMLNSWRQTQEQQHIDDKKQQAEQFGFSKAQSERDFQQRQQQSLMEFQARMAETQANQANSAALRELNMQSMNLQRQFMRQMDLDKEKDSRQQHFDQGTQALQVQLATINKMIQGSSTVPGQNSKQIQSMLDNYNAHAKSLASRADKMGLDYDPELYKPLTAKDVPNHPWLAEKTAGLVGGGTHTELETGEAPVPAETAPAAVPPTTIGRASVVPAMPTLPTGARIVRDKAGKPVGYTTDGKTMEALPGA
jgi:hypothetical protein